jgi:hypothetical protein|tara:strand:- start:328 stop:501 length:174 start_codon:yes stop_codon:yes gene_type:complete
MSRQHSKVVIKIIAQVETEEFVLDEEELPYILEDMLQDILHEVSGVETKDITIKVVR